MYITHSDEVVGKNSNALSLKLSEHWPFENDVYFYLYSGLWASTCNISFFKNDRSNFLEKGANHSLKYVFGPIKGRYDLSKLIPPSFFVAERKMPFFLYICI